MTGGSWKIYWNEYGKDAYLYGSDISFHAKDDVEFGNQLMPPGTVIKRWYSKTNYQSMRIEPALPLIDGEGRYQIRADITSDEFVDAGDSRADLKRKGKYLKSSTGWILKLIYYDRYDVEAGVQIIRDGAGEFQCPLKTYSYELQLVNAGVTRFHFHSITITELEDDEQEIIQDSKKNKAYLGRDRKTHRRRASGEDGRV